MLFDIQFLEPRNEAQKKFAESTIIRQCILCLFDSTNSPLYSYEDLLGHDEALMRDTRKQDSSVAYQKACDEYEALLKRRRGHLPTTAVSMGLLLEEDLSERYPNIGENGFDFGIVIAPTTESGLLLDGANAMFGIFPREQAGKPNDPTGWPCGYDAPPCLITIPLKLDESYFWGMVDSGLSEMLRMKGLTLVMNPNEQSVAGRRREALRATLKSWIMAPLFINDRSKHFFLCHALNALGEWANTKLGGGEVSIAALGAETHIEFGDDEAMTVRPSPFLQRG